ncbi:hypothetical protein [Mesoterricola sediminis]|uniref:Uncharacterized protein n=1 Tax=Mesoterricola sediminis TaxID=2927980 RepID=A0AA48GL94_9BACT|nr:hypothetical protein [Mesoterricola sediminis]BDU75146.1 hypothetical protein METESE_01040 [Mesoterricola sediminis]
MWTMTLSEADLLRGLAALGFAGSGGRAVRAAGSRRQEVRWRPVEALRLGALPPLTRWEVDLIQPDVSDAEAAAFAQAFLRAFQKGGG